MHTKTRVILLELKFKLQTFLNERIPHFISIGILSTYIKILITITKHPAALHVYYVDAPTRSLVGHVQFSRRAPVLGEWRSLAHQFQNIFIYPFESNI